MAGKSRVAWSSPGRFAADFVLDQRRLDDAGGQNPPHRLAQDEWPVLGIGGVRLDREQLVQLHLADDVARPIARLAQVKQLLEADQAAVRVGPAARGPARMELTGLGKPNLIGLDS